ncbi:hypothetical protein M2277_004974 [Paenibacillus sp. LBL]|nr:hypothetical protein [Paenibacillus sp. LBL]
MAEFFQSIHWESFWIGVVVTVVFGSLGAILFNILGEDY